MSKSKKSFKDDEAQKLREAFAILTQGVEMTHYECNPKSKKATKLRKIVWIDSEILRICVDLSRPSLKDRAAGKIPPGIFVRDIADIRNGVKSYEFTKNQSPPEDEDKCLFIVSSERTLCLELPSKFARDWFFERFLLVGENILTAEEKAERRERRLQLTNLGAPPNRDFANVLCRVLQRGVQVAHHHPSGRVLRSVLKANESGDRLVVSPSERVWFGLFAVAPPTSLNLKDIVDIRPGTHSFGFVQTRSTDKHGECLTIVATECVLDLEFANKKARDVFVEKMGNLLRYMAVSGAGNLTDDLDLGVSDVKLDM